MFCPTFQRGFWYFPELFFLFFRLTFTGRWGCPFFVIVVVVIWPIIILTNKIGRVSRRNSPPKLFHAFFHCTTKQMTREFFRKFFKNSNRNSSRISSWFHLFHYGHQDDMRQLNWFTTIIWKALEEFCQAAATTRKEAFAFQAQHYGHSYLKSSRK